MKTLAVLVLLARAGTDAAPPVREETPALSVEVQPPQVKLGEPFWLVIRASAGSELRLPDRIKLEPFEELSREEKSENAAGKRWQVFRLKLVTFQAVGDLKVPFFTLAAAADGGGEGIEVPETPVKVVSLLEGVENPGPRDIAGPVSIWWSDYRPLAAALLLLLWLGLAGWLRWRRRQVTAASLYEPLPPERPAHELALEKLRALVEEQLLRQGRVQEYFDRLSDIVREYLGNRYGFFALDLTTRELLEDLRDRPAPGLDVAALRTLLEDADLVKFARLKPGDEICSRAINTALSIVDATSPRQPEAAA